MKLITFKKFPLTINSKKLIDVLHVLVFEIYFGLDIDNKFESIESISIHCSKDFIFKLINLKSLDYVGEQDTNYVNLTIPEFRPLMISFLAVTKVSKEMQVYVNGKYSDDQSQLFTTYLLDNTLI